MALFSAVNPVKKMLQKLDKELTFLYRKNYEQQGRNLKMLK